MLPVVTVEFENYAASVARVLVKAGAGPVLADKRRIMLKPNLVTASPFPVTTPVALVEAVIGFVRAHTTAEIVIAEGCGDVSLETGEAFRALGYEDLARRADVELVDLNRAELTAVSMPDRPVFKEMRLPRAVFDHFLVSLPVLKAHSFTRYTGTLKNMIGICPPEHYGGVHGSWKKAVFHDRPHQAILDLCAYRAPDLTVLDATVGLAQFHLGGARCEPPVNRLVAGFDPWEVDRKGAELLGLDWRSIPHLRDKPEGR